MTDRELLEMAAKAAGITLEWDGNPDDWMPMYYEGKTYHQWNPLKDDGAALRLAVKLGIDLLFTHEDVEAVATQHARLDDQEMISPWALESWTLKQQDHYAATRLAIVRAAAEIGRAMK